MTWDVEKETNEEPQDTPWSIPGPFLLGVIINPSLWGGSWPSPLPPKGRLTVFLALQDGWTASLRLGSVPQGCRKADN